MLMRTGKKKESKIGPDFLKQKSILKGKEIKSGKGFNMKDALKKVQFD